LKCLSVIIIKVIFAQEELENVQTNTRGCLYDIFRDLFDCCMMVRGGMHSMRDEIEVE
jgi:hypothetical protein